MRKLLSLMMEQSQESVIQGLLFVTVSNICVLFIVLYSVLMCRAAAFLFQFRGRVLRQQNGLTPPHSVCKKRICSMISNDTTLQKIHQLT